MSKTFLIGGGDLDRVSEKIASEANGDNFLIVPFATEKEKREKWVNAVKTAFLKFKDFNFDIVSENDSVIEIKKKIKDASIIFFTGGLPEKIIDEIKKLNIQDLLSNFEGVLVGYSAGALAFSKYCLITKDDDYKRTMIIRGLGLVNFTVSVHYDENEDNELINFSNILDIYAIPDKSMIINISDKIDYFGNIFLFRKGLKIKE
ncbi:MAG: Type 1 glutamine amidotransferase-like domain-containing protein [Nanoarchaeota archaeon]|nr:Type 1 glutamine amidotransferase-like domain-containing protein [Nanoarchaeota archaeon]